MPGKMFICGKKKKKEICFLSKAFVNFKQNIDVKSIFMTQIKF